MGVMGFSVEGDAKTLKETVRDASACNQQHLARAARADDAIFAE